MEPPTRRSANGSVETSPHQIGVNFVVIRGSGLLLFHCNGNSSAMNDEELLKAYVSESSQDAFAELVRRHVGLVYATALRQLRESSTAQEVTQQTFCALAQKAGTVRDPRHVAAWLHRTSHQLSVLHIRTEQRRTRREQAAMNLITPQEDNRWEELEPLLDQGLGNLSDADRTALLLRYFEARPMAEVGAALGISEAAAKMRIGRALEKLRSGFARQGIACSAAGLALLFEQHTQAAVPEGIATSILAATRNLVPATTATETSMLGFFRRAFLPLAGATALVLGTLVATSRLGQSAAPENASTDSSVSAVLATDPPPMEVASLASEAARRIQFRVVDEGTGEPLSGVQIRATEMVGSIPPAEVTTDAQGQCILLKPTDSSGDFHFRVTARHDGYVSKWVSWSRFQRDDVSDIPNDYVIRLTRGIQIGGLVNDTAGQSIPGATVEVYGESTSKGTPPRDRAVLENYGRETVTTDEQGRWSYSGLPTDWSRVTFTFRSPEFVEAKFITDTSDRTYIGAVRLPTADLLAKNAVVTLTNGGRLTGRVVDTQGNPIVGARIVQNREWGDPLRRTESAEDGTFEFRNLNDGPQTLSVQASGFAATSTEVRVPVTSDIKIQMAPGRIVRGRVIDESHNGVARAEVELAAPDGYRPEFLLDLKTDREGRFTWDQAPNNELPLTIFKSGFSVEKVSLPTDGTETTIVLKAAGDYRPIRVIGRVVDDQKGTPLERFRIFVAANGDDYGVEKSGEEGAFALTLLGSESSIEVRAPGYQPVRQDLKLNGATEVSLEFRLTAAAGWSGFVLLPNGQPAAGVEVALMTSDKRATLGDRRFLWKDEANIVITESDGAFHFDPEPPEMPVGRVLVAVHAQGYADRDADQFVPGSLLRLQPWGRVEGIVQGRSTYPPQLKVHLLIRSWNPWFGLMGDADRFSAIPNERGEFAFEHLPPGFYSIGLVPYGSGAIDKRLTFQVLPGKTSRIEANDEGLAISGRLLAADLPADFDFSHSTAVFERRQERPVDLPRIRFKDYPDAKSFEQASQQQTPKLIAYWQSAEGLSAWMEQRTYAVRLNADGTLIGRAIPPGDYDLKVVARIAAPGQAISSHSHKILKSVKPIRIDPAVDGSVNGQVDLGRIELGKAF